MEITNKDISLLKAIADFFITGYDDCILGCRMHSDRFFALFKVCEDTEAEMAMDLQQLIMHFAKVIAPEFPLANVHLNCGAYIIGKDDMNVSEIVDKAEMARKSAKNNYLTSLVFYDNQIEEKAKLLKEYGLAGIASWRLGYEKNEIWDVILKYVN